MEKRIKSIGSYQKSGKLFINEYNQLKLDDSLEKNEYYVDFFKNGSIKNPYVDMKFNDNNINYINYIKNNNINSSTVSEWWEENYYKPKRINHIFKSPSTLLNEIFLNFNFILATPSSYENGDYDTFSLEYNESYNKNINTNQFIPYFYYESSLKKNIVEKNSNIKSNLFKNSISPFNDISQKYFHINTQTFFNSNNQFGLLKDNTFSLSNKDFNIINQKLINNELNKINSTDIYSNLDSNQKVEKTIEIDLDIPNDLILQYMAKTTEDDIIRAPLNGQLIDTNQEVYFKKITTTNNEQIPLLNSVRFKNNIIDRKINRFNTPFAIYNFKFNNWENRGLFFPLLHITKNYLDNNLPGKFRSIIPQNNALTTTLQKINYTNNNITLFLEYFKKYFISHDPLTSIPTLMFKKKGKSIETNDNDQLGKYNNYAHTIISLPTEQFGFPNHYKFHCFEDNLIKLSDYIENPFVLSRTNFTANVEVIGEFTTEDSRYYEEPFNLCLNYFLIKQTEIDRNTNVTTKIKPFANKSNISNYNFNYVNESNENIEEFKLNNLELDFDNINSLNLYGEDYVVRKLSNDLDHYGFNYANINGNFYLNGYLNSNDKIPLNQNKKYLREIVNYGNILFLTPSINAVKRKDNNDKLYQLLENNNFDSFKIIEYPDHLNLLNTNTLNGLIDFSGEININSICKIPSQLKIQHNLNLHLLNLNFDLPSNNNFQKFSGSRTLDEITSSKQFLSKKLSNLQIKNTLDYTLSSTNTPFIYSNENNLIEIPSNIMTDYYLPPYQNLSNNLSQYILYPTDKIAICVSISPSIHPLKAKQLIKIKKGKCKISLFGYHKNESKKIYDENKLLKNYKSNNFPNIIIGDILNSNKNSDFKELNYLNYLDKQIDKTLNFYNSRGLDQNYPSILKQGKTFIPYLRIGNDYNLNIKEKFIYDDAFLQYTKEEETTGLNKKYFVNNIFNSVLNYKKYKYSIPLSAIITQSGTEYVQEIDDFTQNMNNLNLKSFNMYFNSKRYGQFSDIIERRKHTTMYNVLKNQKESIIEKQYINSIDGTIITDTSTLYGTNKSLTYELINSKGVPVSAEENITFEDIENLPFPFSNNINKWNNNWTWSHDDIKYKLKHVAFRENVSS